MAGPFYASAELPVPHSRNLFMSRGWESTDLHLPAFLCADPEPLLPALLGGELNPVVAATFSFEQASVAHRYLAERRNIGKVVLVP